MDHYCYIKRSVKFLNDIKFSKVKQYLKNATKIRISKKKIDPNRFKPNVYPTNHFSNIIY